MIRGRVLSSSLVKLGIGFLCLSGLMLFGNPSTMYAQNNCMGNQAVGNVQGVGGPNDLNCTANDVSVAQTTVLSGPQECVEGDVIQVQLAADLQSSSTSSRSDIGIWLAEDGGDAVTGACQHFYFDNANQLSDLDSGDTDDICGDIGGQELFQDVPLDTPSSALSLVCRDDDSDGVLDIGSCIAWKIPGDDDKCDAGDIAIGTLPANKAKCNCGAISIPITVKQEAFIEVIKDLLPAGDTGTFDLQIDGNTIASGVGDLGTTGRTKVSAGTAIDPGDTHTVGEAGATLNTYNSEISCVDRGANTYNGGPPLTVSGPGPLSVDVEPDDDIVCTISNIKHTPTPTPTPTDTPTPTPTDTPTPTPTDTPTPTPTDTATPTPTPTFTPEPAEFQGCTPGYWRQKHHYFAWTHYSPGDSFDDVFGVTYGGTLGEAVKSKKGGEDALARHAVAALLNAASSGVDYPYTTSEIIAMVQAAYASGDIEGTKDMFEAANEAGCPLGNGKNSSFFDTIIDLLSVVKISTN